MSDIKVNIVGEFQKKGFDDADKATNKLDKSFKKLGKTLLGLFAAREIVRFGKASVKAFAEEDRAVKNLTQSLQNLGLGYNVGAIERFVEATQAATGVSDSQLRPAMVELIQVTLDAQEATNLLVTAMDLSAGTGASLDSSVKALSRAYNGNYTSLGRLQRVYTSAELETMGFANAVSALNDTFGGTAAANADSYQGKIDRLNVAMDEAKETVGEGLVTAFERLADGDFNKVIDLIAASARGLSSLLNNIAFSIQYTKALLKTGWTIGADEQAQLDFIRAQWMGAPDISNTQAANRVFLKNMSSQLTLQKKIAAERQKTAKASEQEKKNQAALSKAKATFDLEKIQIEAALQGRITEEERTRLLLMKAIAEENVDEATKLAAKLKDLQDQTIKLAAMLTSFPKANDPFADWLDTLAKLHKSLIDIESITKNRDSSVSAGNAAMAAGDYAASLAQSYTAKADATVAIAAAANAAATATTPEEKAAADAFKAAAESANAAADALSESVSALAMIAAMADLQAATDLYNESLSAVSSTGAGSVTVNVNVEGSVISEGDLAETITNIQYEMQRRGQTVLIDSVAI